MEFNKDACTDRLAALCDAVYPEKYAETADAKADYIISEIKDVVEKVNIPTKLDEFGVKKEDLDFLVKAGSQQTRLLVNNCKELSLDDIRYLYEKLYLRESSTNDERQTNHEKAHRFMRRAFFISY